MITKEYLNRAYRLNEKIEKNTEVLANLRDAATGMCAYSDSDRVQTSNYDSSRIAMFVDTAIDLERIIAEQRKELMAIRREIEDAIDTLDDYQERLILKLRFLEYKSWSQICTILCYSRTTVYKKSNEGIEKLKHQLT